MARVDKITIKVQMDVGRSGPQIDNYGNEASNTKAWKSVGIEREDEISLQGEDPAKVFSEKFDEMSKEVTDSLRRLFMMPDSKRKK